MLASPASSPHGRALGSLQGRGRLAMNMNLKSVDSVQHPMTEC